MQTLDRQGCLSLGLPAYWRATSSLCPCLGRSALLHCRCLHLPGRLVPASCRASTAACGGAVNPHSTTSKAAGATHAPTQPHFFSGTEHYYASYERHWA